MQWSGTRVIARNGNVSTDQVKHVIAHILPNLDKKTVNHGKPKGDSFGPPQNYEIIEEPESDVRISILLQYNTNMFDFD